VPSGDSGRLGVAIAEALRDRGAADVRAAAARVRLETDFAPERVVPEVRTRLNACGGGAIAAMLAACVELGATKAALLRHANSFETLAGVMPQKPVDAVGYASVVVG